MERMIFRAASEMLCAISRKGTDANIVKAVGLVLKKDYGSWVFFSHCAAINIRNIAAERRALKRLPDMEVTHR